MDDKTTIKELKEKIKKFCGDRDWDQYHNAKELVIGIITESSELLHHFRFKSEKDVDKMFQDENKKSKISEEIADTLYFLLRLVQRYDIDLTTALNKKMEKNEEKYPIEKAKGSNKKYNEL
ncbi:nucleotide pyrophosphohydrolase [Candidatus Woesearchaeota archaeon]|nr:nucleotide pyrophosphohydrolase [Candidatus Woesearchaeota archaeon]